MELLTRLRAEVPLGGVSPRAEDRFLAAINSERAVVPAPGARLSGVRVLRPAWRLAVIAGLVVALAAGLIVASLGSPGDGHGPSATLTVQLLADRAATAARSGPAVPPGQWVYRKVACGGYLYELSWEVIPCPAGTLDTWSTADDTKVAYFHGGKLYVNSVAGYYGKLKFPVPPWVSIYAARASLPADPSALVIRLGSIGLFAGKTTADRAFNAFGIISQWLGYFVPSPALTAELYQALADLPGVRIDKNAVDIDGRHGVGFAMSYPRDTGDLTRGWQEIILNPGTYQFLGLKHWDSTGTTVTGTAVLRQALVSGPGVRP
jgi:hypothetical protein